MIHRSRQLLRTATSSALAVSLLSGGGSVWAQGPVTSPPDEPAKPQKAGVESPSPADEQGPLLVAIFPKGQVDEAALCRAIEAELGRMVTVQPTGGLRGDELLVELSKARVRVVYRNPDGRAVERRIQRPPGEELIEVVALLTGNLARNEAEELLDELRPAEAAPPKAEPPPPKPEPPPVRSTTREDPSHVTSNAGSAPPVAPDGDDVPPLKPAVVQLALWYPVAVMPDGEDRWASFALSAFYGRVGGIYGVGIDGVVGVVDRQLHGVHLAGAWSHHADHTVGLVVGGAGTSSNARHIDGAVIGGAASINLAGAGRMRGMQVAGAVSYHAGLLQGVQIAGAVNLAPHDDGPLSGAQISGAFNWAADVDGLQVTGAANAAEDVVGAQLAAAVNVSDDLEGVQVSVLNIADDVDGSQIGQLNVADDVHGAQLGLVNVGDKVKGVQIGLINIADEVEGTQIGLLSTGGTVQAASWMTTEMMVHLGVKSLVGHVHTLASLGYRPALDERRLEPQFAIGGHLPIGDFFGEIELGWTYPVLLDETHESQHVMLHRLVAGWQPSKWIGVFVNGGIRHELNDRRVGPEGGVGLLLL